MLKNVRRMNRDVIFSSFIAIISICFLLLPSIFQSPYAQQVARYRGRVLEVDNSRLQQFGIVKAGGQVLRVRLLNGPYAGEEIQATNDLIGKMETDKVFQEGDIALLVLKTHSKQIISAIAYDHYRIPIEILLVMLFVALLIGFAGWTGLKALLSFVFAVIWIWKALLPGILRGWDPILVTLFVVAVLSAVTMTLVAGVSKKALVALLGSLLGVMLTCILAILLFPSFRFHGAILPFSETLLYTGFEHLNLSRIFLSAVVLGASGAVMDLAIDVSASMAEVVEKRPDLSRSEAIASGFAVGRAMTSTMVTTLLMAYTAGYMALLMIFIAQGVPPLNIINTNYVAAEILKTLVGSFGLVTVAPFTAIAGGFIYIRHKESDLQRVSAIERLRTGRSRAGVEEL